MDRKQKICIVIIVITIIVTAIVYNIVNKQEKNKNTVATIEKNSSIKKEEKNDKNVQEEKKEEVIVKQEEKKEQKEENNYVGVEEKNDNKPTGMTENEKKDKAIMLVKNEWGNDNNVYFSVEKINGTKYYISVRNNGTANASAWYEVDTENWIVEEY